MTDKTPPGTNPDEIKASLAKTWMQTVMGAGSLAALVVGAALLFGFHFGIAMVVLGVFALIPIFSWFNSASIVKKVMHCQEPNPDDPEHARLIAIVDRVFPKTGLSVKPAVYVSPMPIANAFATGRSPNNALIAVTEGLFLAELDDHELEAVIAHELAHVKNYDAAITSMLAAMASLFSLLVATGMPWLFKDVYVRKSGAPLLNKLAKKADRKKRFFDPVGGFFGLVFVMVLFYIVSIFAKLITLFVSRARENSADACAAMWTGNPCWLSSALQKLVQFEHRNGGNMKMMLLVRGMTPLFIVNAFGEDDGQAKPKASFGARLRNWWNRAGQHHPPIAERLSTLDKLSGGSCPRL
jgi:heat shock protein HtpX